MKERVKRSAKRQTESLSKDETLRMRQQHVGPSLSLFFASNPLKMVRGDGQYLYDELGNEYLDCINNVAHVGHGNKRLLEAVSGQLSLLNTNTRFLHDNLSLYAKRLTSLMPAHLSVCYLVNSGSEANDLAMRLARAYTKREDVVSIEGAYHGNLTSTMAISPYKTERLVGGAWNKPEWAHVAPMPCEYRGRYARDSALVKRAGNAPDTIGRLYAADAARLIEEAKRAGRQVGAFFVESMISCGGQMPLPCGYLRHLQDYLHKEGALLVCDEVQTGFGRCGKHMWAFQLDGDDIKPDIVTLGKPIGNGFPVAAVVTTKEVAAAFKAIGVEYFNTFGGNPVSCAAAMAVLDELEERNLVAEAQRIGSYLMEEMRRLEAHSSLLADVRGHGFFIGAELVEDKLNGRKQPASEAARYLVNRFRDEKILMSVEGRHENVLKFKPPMVFSMDNAKRFIGVLERALNELEIRRSAGRASL